jgi:glycosyltransferase involved in cell wall biosynthesis
MKPQVSILIPAYNRKPFIADCIQSALDQTFTDFEVVVVDNASDDGTWETCKQFALLDTRVRVFRNNTNIGPVRNWQRCIEEARGEFSKILFSDDLLEPNCLNELISGFQWPDVGLVYSTVRIGPRKSQAELTYYTGATGHISSDQFRNLVLNNKAPVSPGAVLLRTRDLLSNLQLNFPTATPQPFEWHGAGPDVISLLLTTERYPRVFYIANPLVFFRAHAGSITTANESNMVELGYTSALSYFLSNKNEEAEWINYLGQRWLHHMLISKKWIKIKSFLVSHEGSGTVTEQTRLMLSACKSILSIISYKLLGG